jgi:predicted ATPase
VKRHSAGKRGRERAAPDRGAFHGGGFIRWVEIHLPADASGYPYDVPAIRATERIELHPAVTFFIGENGTGKSTLIEAIASKAGFDLAGGWKRSVLEEQTTDAGLSACLRVARDDYPSDGWFLRAESFHSIATQLDELDKQPFCAHGFTAYGGRSLHEQSHGESFLALLAHRLQGHGLYIFDEPEAALSPMRQMGVLSLLHRLVYHRSQLIIATHSPILLAYPHSRIYAFEAEGIREVRYTETEPFTVTRDFLNRHERMLEILLREEEAELRRQERAP